MKQNLARARTDAHFYYVSMRRQAVALLAVVALVVAPVARADRTPLRPGWNLFSPDQDVQVGQQVSKDAERQLNMMNDSRVDNYLNNIGQRLTAHAPGYKFHYTYKAVNDPAINAFALPGGYIYINRGTIEAADTEAQLAGVMAHETSHVALRHGTNQASKTYAAQMPLAVLGGVLGNSAAGILTQLGAGFTLNSILLKYSRTDESQADIMGTQILYDSGYDPRAMAQFLEKIQAMDKGGHHAEFFSDHPSPDRRVERVMEEVDKLGGPPSGAKTNTREFDDIKRYVHSMPVPPPRQGQRQGNPGNTRGNNGGSRNGQPDWPSNRFTTLNNSLLRIDYPDNWQAYAQGDAASIAPRGGLVDDGNGNQALAYGVIINAYQPHVDSYGQQLQPQDYGNPSSRGNNRNLEQWTDQLVSELRQSNRNMRVVRSHEYITVDGENALSTYLSNSSPLGGRETNWLITMEHPQGLLFLVFTAPEREFQNYENVFQRMLRSARINRGYSSGRQPSDTGSYENSSDYAPANRNNDYVAANRNNNYGAAYNDRQPEVLPAGTQLTVLTNETIDSRTASPNQRFSAQIQQDVVDNANELIVPKGSPAELIIRAVSSGGTTGSPEITLDLHSITVGGKRYLVSTSDVQQKGREGLGANKRTAEMVGGGALVGTIIGAIVGHGKGAAIGAAVGAAGGAGAQVLTKGKEVIIPAETTLKFKLDQPVTLAPEA
ncbi:MAG TPA: M48 family metallopeptidase [Candidatus Dormibacteraeota bacterium]|nr:M48 family metallopeptidase [Candidatus Dormibacteraeota bacterium]